MSEDKIERGNLFTKIPGDLPDEFVKTLAEGSGNLKIERIVSRGHSSPPDFWFDQDTIEWVVLLKGRARLEVEHESETFSLEPGDWMKIPSGCRHRVEETNPAGDCVWLAVHWK